MLSEGCSVQLVRSSNISTPTILTRPSQLEFDIRVCVYRRSSLRISCMHRPMGNCRHDHQPYWRAGRFRMALRERRLSASLVSSLAQLRTEEARESCECNVPLIYSRIRRDRYHCGLDVEDSHLAEGSRGYSKRSTRYSRRARQTSTLKAALPKH